MSTRAKANSDGSFLLLKAKLLSEAVRLTSRHEHLPVDLESIMKSFRIQLRRRHLVASEAMLVQKDNGQRRIYLPQYSRPAVELLPRERFSVAHEIGHLVLEDVLNDSQGTAVGKAETEHLCDYFASELLLPTRTVMQFIETSLKGNMGPISLESLRELAHQAAISLQATCFAVSRTDGRFLMACFGNDLGQHGTSQERHRALRLRWSTRTKYLPYGLFRSKRIPKDSQLFGSLVSRGFASGVFQLYLPPLPEGDYAIEFGKYDTSSQDYLMSMFLEIADCSRYRENL